MLAIDALDSWVLGENCTIGLKAIRSPRASGARIDGSKVSHYGSQMTLSVIIPTVDRKDAVLRLLTSIVSQNPLPDELIIVEQGTTTWNADDFPAPLRSSLRVLTLNRKSAAAARDAGQKAARGDLLFFFDDDILLPACYMSYALLYLNAHPECMAVGGPYVDEHVQTHGGILLFIGRLLRIYGNGTSNRVLPSGWADYVRGPHAQYITSAEWLFGCNLVVRATVFERVSFESQMQRWSFLDDVFFGMRLKQQFGDCMRVFPFLCVTHAPVATSGALDRSVIRMRILHRYILWRDLVAARCKGSSLSFASGMLANLLLTLKQTPQLWVVRETMATLGFMLKNRSMDWETANGFILPKD
jgi:glycosyltransferase involved in cell wall biosynthesis